MSANADVSKLSRRRLLTLSLLMGSAAVSGCIVVPVGRGRRGGGRYSTAEAEIVVEPPGPQVEVIGIAPGPGYFWIGGNWRWGGGRYAWAPGRWEPTRPGYRWEPHRWSREGRNWREAPGHWSR